MLFCRIPAGTASGTGVAVGLAVVVRLPKFRTYEIKGVAVPHSLRAKVRGVPRIQKGATARTQMGAT